EVVRGPTSVLYGSDALGGTINAVTSTPHFSGAGFDLNTRVLCRYGSADQEKTTRAELGIHSRRFAFQAGFSYKDYEDLRRGKNSRHPQIEKSTNGLYQSPTGFSATDFDSKMVFGLTPLQTLTVAYQMTRKTDIPRYDKYENDGFFHWMYNPQNRDLAYLTYENRIQSRFVSSLRASVSYQRQREGREQQKNATSQLTKEMDDVRTLGLTLQFHSLFRKHLFTYGADLYMDDVASRRIFVDPGTGAEERDVRGLYPDGSKYNSLGIFLQDEIRFTPRWTVIPGVRTSSFWTRFSIPPDTSSLVQLGNIRQRFRSVTGSLGIIRKLGRGTFFNVNIGQAFRAPNLSDITKLGESKGNTYEVPNPNLVPEKMLSIDVGLKFDFDRVKATASVYYARITDILASADATVNGSSTIEKGGNVYKVKSKQNIGDAFIRGFEASFDCNVYRRVSFRTNITTTFGQNTTLDEPVGKIPPAFGLAGLRWNGGSFTCDATIRFAAKQDRLSADDRDDPRIPEGGTPAWTIVNFRAGLDMWKFSRLQLAVENIFDTNYREHCSGVNGPGRNFIVSVELRK
ncbi:MAG: TonB-dependent receptor, partial [bacterium]